MKSHHKSVLCNRSGFSYAHLTSNVLGVFRKSTRTEKYIPISNNSTVRSPLSGLHRWRRIIYTLITFFTQTRKFWASHICSCQPSIFSAFTTSYQKSSFQMLWISKGSEYVPMYLTSCKQIWGIYGFYISCHIILLSIIDVFYYYIPINTRYISIWNGRLS